MDIDSVVKEFALFLYTVRSLDKFIYNLEQGTCIDSGHTHAC